MDILVNKLYNGGKIKDKCENAGFYERLTLIEQQFKGTAVLLHKMNHFPDGFRKIWAHERLLNVVEQLIGPDIAGRLSVGMKLMSRYRGHPGRPLLNNNVTYFSLSRSHDKVYYYYFFACTNRVSITLKAAIALLNYLPDNA